MPRMDEEGEGVPVGVAELVGVVVLVGESEGDTAGKLTATEKSGKTTLSPALLQVWVHEVKDQEPALEYFPVGQRKLLG